MLYLDFSRFAKSYIIDFYKTLAQLPKLRVASSSLVCRSNIYSVGIQAVYCYIPAL